MTFIRLSIHKYLKEILFQIVIIDNYNFGSSLVKQAAAAALSLSLSLSACKIYL